LITNLFLESQTPAEFQEAVAKLEGTFPFGRDEMIELGKSYESRFPEDPVRRNPEDIRFGYRIAKICLVEKLLQGMNQSEKKNLRNYFLENRDAQKLDKQFRRGVSREGFQILLRKLNDRSEAFGNRIKTLPKSIFKERLIGALSNLITQIYLFRQLFGPFEQHPDEKSEFDRDSANGCQCP
jgi:hypothetical protein